MSIIQKGSHRIQNVVDAATILRKKKILTWLELGELLSVAVTESTSSQDQAKVWSEFATDLTRGVVYQRYG